MEQQPLFNRNWSRIIIFHFKVSIKFIRISAPATALNFKSTQNSFKRHYISSNTLMLMTSLCTVHVTLLPLRSFSVPYSHMIFSNNRHVHISRHLTRIPVFNVRFVTVFWQLFSHFFFSIFHSYIFSALEHSIFHHRQA